ncbi:MAG TPA: hypothetical protein VGO28_04815 [Acidimicrobiia bacterium]
MHSVVQIPLDPAPRLVGGGDDPGARRCELGPASLHVSCPLDHSHLEVVPGFAKLVFRSPALVDEARVLKRHRSVIGGGGEQQVIDVARKIGATTRRRDESALGVHSDGDHHPTVWLCLAYVRNDFPM